MTLPPPRRQNLAVNVLLALGVSLLLGLALEGGSRWLESRRPAPVAREPYLWDWQTMWEDDFYTVGSGSLGWPPDEEFNPDGLRDRAHAEEPRPRTVRLALLGDSVTLGAGIAAEEAYPQVLQERLDEQGHRVEVFNVALWGWSTRQQRTAYRRILRRYRPDQVVLAVCLNDIAELQNNLARPAAWLQRLHERSALVRLVLDAQGREIRRVEELFETPDARAVREGYVRFFDEVRALRDEVRDGGAGFALMVFPFRFQVAAGAPPPEAQARMAEFARAESIPFLDLLPALAPLGEAAFVDYDHLSAAGARATAGALLSSALLPRSRSHRDELGPDTAPAAWRSLLADREPARREAAAWALGRARLGQDAAAAAALVAALGHDPDAGVRSAAADALGRVPQAAQAAAPALFAALRDPSQPVRWASARALAARPPGNDDPAELERLVAALQNDDLYVRAFAAWSLGSLGPRGAPAVDALVEALQREGASRGVAARALANLGPAAHAAIPALVTVLGSPEAARRWNAALALGLLGPPARPAQHALVARLDDTDARVRSHAARALGRLGAGEAGAVAALTRALARDPAADVRAMAARALGLLRPEGREARHALERALGDDVRRVRVEARKALDALAREPHAAGAPDAP